MISSPALKYQRIFSCDALGILPHAGHAPQAGTAPQARGRKSKAKACKKENCAPTNDFKEDQPRLRRTSRGTRLSERWSVLSKFIRANKVTGTLASTSEEAEDDADVYSDTSDDECGISFTASKEGTRPKLQRHHAHSPKVSSPLTGMPSTLYSSDPRRYSYGNHGYSYSALCHQRFMWAKRKCAWDDYEYQMEAWRALASAANESVYGGIASCPDTTHSQMSPPPLKQLWNAHPTDAITGATLEPPCMTPVPLHTDMISPAIFPRVGDLSSLHDPFLLSVDAWFAEFPSWTMSKLAWTYDLNRRLASNEKSESVQVKPEVAGSFMQVPPEDISIDSEQENFHDFSISSISTTSSDVTLVDVTPNSHCRNTSQDPSDVPVYMTPILPSLEEHQSRAILQGKAASLPWNRSWPSRWEALYHQVRLAVECVGESGRLDQSTEIYKEASRILLTTGKIYYDPEDDAAHECCSDYESDVEEEFLDETHTSLSRNGAAMDPLLMFATLN